jgi:hypothetical protein
MARAMSATICSFGLAAGRDERGGGARALGVEQASPLEARTHHRIDGERGVHKAIDGERRLRVIATGGLIAARDFPSEAFLARPDRDCMNPGQRLRVEA